MIVWKGRGAGTLHLPLELHLHNDCSGRVSVQTAGHLHHDIGHFICICVEAALCAQSALYHAGTILWQSYTAGAIYQAEAHPGWGHPGMDKDLPPHMSPNRRQVQEMYPNEGSVFALIVIGSEQSLQLLVLHEAQLFPRCHEGGGCAQPVSGSHGERGSDCDLSNRRRSRLRARKP